MGNDSARPVPPTLVDANRLWVDSRVRALVQRRVEAPLLLRLGGAVPGGRVLELGTGRRGTGLRLALEVFGAAHADGVERYEPSVAACRDAVRDLGGRVDVQPGDATERTEARTAVRDALRGLPDNQREALVLAYWGGLTADEIAQRVQVPLGTAKSRIRLGLAKLRSERAMLAVA